jgi:hypothetical protein
MTQCAVGRFNLAGSDETLEFSLSIRDDEGKCVSVGDNYATIKYSGEPDEKDDFEEWHENLGWVFNKCFRYSKRIWGSTDYVGNALLFAKVYRENFEELNTAYVEERKASLERQIERLQEQLARTDLQDFSAEVLATVNEEVEMYEKWIATSETELAQFMPESEMAGKCTEKIAGYRAKIEKLKAQI